MSKAADSTEDGTDWMLGQANNGQNRLQFRLKSGGVTTTLIASAGNLPLILVPRLRDLRRQHDASLPERLSGGLGRKVWINFAG